MYFLILQKAVGYNFKLQFERPFSRASAQFLTTIVTNSSGTGHRVGGVYSTFYLIKDILK